MDYKIYRDRTLENFLENLLNLQRQRSARKRFIKNLKVFLNLHRIFITFFFCMYIYFMLTEVTTFKYNTELLAPYFRFGKLSRQKYRKSNLE